MLMNIDRFAERYRRDEDPCAFSVMIEMDAFALIRELLGVIGKLEDAVIRLREEVNDIAIDAQITEDIPYPFPASDVPTDAFYVSELIRSLYNDIFSEDIDR
jgi:hypothetical protein